MAERTYRIGEAADILELKSSVLRFWETEFTQLAPSRTDKGQRLYTETHLALLRRIKQLLYDQGMTIEGARRALAAKQEDVVPDSASVSPVSSAQTNAALLCLVRDELRELRALLLSR